MPTAENLAPEPVKPAPQQQVAVHTIAAENGGRVEHRFVVKGRWETGGGTFTTPLFFSSGPWPCVWPLVESVALDGVEYRWRVITLAPDDAKVWCFGPEEALVKHVDEEIGAEGDDSPMRVP